MTVSEAIEEIDIQVDPNDPSPSNIRAIRMAFNEIRPNIIEWHPYPAEKPSKANHYLVTTNSKEVEIDAWSGEHWNFLPPSYILAWAELPKPYEEKP